MADAKEAAKRAAELRAAAGAPTPEAPGNTALSPPEGRAAPSGKARSALAGFLDAATLGAAPHIAAGQRQFDNPILAATVGSGVGIVDALANLVGKSKFDASGPKSIMDEALSAHPGYAMGGEVLGSILPGAGLASGGIRATEMAAARGPGLVRSAADALANRLPGRVATATASGATQGALTAANKDEGGLDIAESAGIGALGGAVGQAVFGEAIPAIARWATKSSSKTAARAHVGAEVKQSMMGAIDPATGQPSAEGFIPSLAMTQEAQRLGPGSTLMDVNPGAKDVASGALSHDTANRQMYPVRNMMEERLGNETPGFTRGPSTEDNFKDEINSLLPGLFKRQAGDISEARAADIMKDDAKAYFKSLSPQFEKVLAEAPDQYTMGSIHDDVTRAFDQDNLTPYLTSVKDKVIDGVKFQANQGGNKAALNPKQLHTFRTQLDQMITDEYKAQSPNYRSIGMLTETRNAVSDRLGQIPEFAELNSKYASEASYNRAAELGHKLLTAGEGSMSPEKVESYMLSANPGDRQGFMEGLSSAIGTLMDKGGISAARKISKNDVLGKKLMAAFPSEGEAMIEAANKALKLNSTAGDLVRNSATAGRLRAKSSLGGEHRTLDKVTVAGMVLNFMFPGKGVSKAAGLGAVGRLLPDPEDPVFNTELGRILSAQGESGISGVLPQLQQANDQFRLPASLGGVDKTLGVRSGEIPPSLLNQALATDVGQAPAFMLSQMAIAGKENNPAALKRRSR